MESLGGIEVVPAIMVLLVFGVIFAFLREFFCWYWKINERLQLQKEQIELTKELIAAVKGEVEAPAESEDA